jgi:predicted nucleic acid-binding protein
LIALARLGLLTLLPAVFRHAWLTPTVLQECEAKPDRGEGASIRAAVAEGYLELLAPKATLPLWGIDPGETSTIALAMEKGAGVLMDDKAGRRVANRVGISVIGTAGVLVLAKRRGRLISVGSHLQALLASGYFLGAHVVADALRAAGE